MSFIMVCTLIDNDYASLLFFQTFFRIICGMLNEFANGFERKVWRVQVAHLHNAARARLSRCFPSVVKGEGHSRNRIFLPSPIKSLYGVKLITEGSASEVHAMLEVSLQRSPKFGFSSRHFETGAQRPGRQAWRHSVQEILSWHAWLYSK